MAKPYALEMSKLSTTLEWASTADIAPLAAAVRSAFSLPLRAIGSGGSLTAAHCLAFLHRNLAGQIAVVETPFEATGSDIASPHSAWLLSAGGGNVDIISAFKNLSSKEPRQLAVLCGKHESPLSELTKLHDYADFLPYPPPAGKDGFLATNSLLGFSALLVRAYLSCGPDAESAWSVVHNIVAEAVDLNSASSAKWKRDCIGIWGRSTTLVLHGNSTRIGAVDLESKFTEAALGNLQVADWRNFAHGRHHWLAKHGAASSILALVDQQDEVIAKKTLGLVPENVPICEIRLPGPSTAAALSSLAAALRITEWAGEARGIDPGRPGVPDFGRKLYNLPLPREPKKLTLGAADAAAIRRKSGFSTEELARNGDLDSWKSALGEFKSRLASTRFAGVVLDYDGTLVDVRKRFDGPTSNVVAQLRRLLEHGAIIGIATGRGASVRTDLQAALPPEYWNRVFIGYYNGAEVAELGNTAQPRREGKLDESLQGLATAFALQPEIARNADVSLRPLQITLEPKRLLPESRLWDLAQQVILSEGNREVIVTRSSHSVDIVPQWVTKRSVIGVLKQTAPEGEFLAIGDRARWPGNDYDLLRTPFALSVDEVSVTPNSGWNLGAEGQRGVSITLGYLEALQESDGQLRFNL